MAAVDTHARLVGGAGTPPMVRGHERVHQEGPQAEAAAQLPAGHCQQGGVAAVTVEEDEPFSASGRYRPANIGGHRQQRLARQPQRARRPGVLVGLGDGQRGQQPGVGLLTAFRHRRPRGLVGDHVIHQQGKMRSVLLGGTDRPHQRGRGADALGYLGAGEVIQPSLTGILRWGHAVTLPVRVARRPAARSSQSPGHDRRNIAPRGTPDARSGERGGAGTEQTTDRCGVAREVPGPAEQRRQG